MTLRRRHHERRGSVYMLVLGAAMLVTVIGITASYAMMLQNRRAGAAEASIKSRLYAQAATEMAAFWMRDDPEWRTNRPHGWWVVDEPIEDGAFSLRVVDPADADLADSGTDSVRLTCAGTQGDARHMFSVTMEAVVPDSTPALEALGSALHAGSDIRVGAGAFLTVNGGPASTNTGVKNDGTITGDVEAPIMSGFGTVVGTTTVPAPTKDLPESTVFSDYVGRATQLPYSGHMQGVVLAPGANTYGGSLDVDGTYYIDTGGQDIVIEGTRLHGTLVIDAPLNTVTIKTAALLQPYRADYPVLVVRGNLEFSFAASASGLLESDWSTNFNPAGAPYLTTEDSDQLDAYPSEIEGLVHCTGNLSVVSEAALVNGVVLCEGGAGIDSELTINHDPDLVTSPPLGYTQDPANFAEMRIVRGSWRQLVE